MKICVYYYTHSIHVIIYINVIKLAPRLVDEQYEAPRTRKASTRLEIMLIRAVCSQSSRAIIAN